MQLTKYSKYKDKVYATVSTGDGGNNSTTSTTERNLWGNDDSGNDMNGSMRIQGNIYVMGETWTEDENGEPIPTTRSGEASSRAGDEFPPSSDDGEGNLYLDGTVYAEGVTTNGDITAGRHLYIKTPHPDHNGEKVCILEYIKSLILPVGSIIMYKGNSPLPDGWYVCDGTNGTPDLRGKFIKASDVSGATGGSNQITLSAAQLPSHRHSVTLTPTDWFVMSKSTRLSEFVVDKGGSSNFCLYTGEDGGENYSTLGSISGYTSYEGEMVDGTGKTIDIQPEYYSLIFIMKVR